MPYAGIKCPFNTEPKIPSTCFKFTYEHVMFGTSPCTTCDEKRKWDKLSPREREREYEIEQRIEMREQTLENIREAAKP